MATTAPYISSIADDVLKVIDAIITEVELRILMTEISCIVYQAENGTELHRS